MNITFEQLPYVYQTEALISVEWLRSRGVQTGSQQLENDLKQEVLKIWNEEKYDQNNVLRHLTNNNAGRGFVVRILNRFLSYKRTSRFEDGIDNSYRGENGRWIPMINSIYQKQFQAWTERTEQLQNQLTQSQILNQQASQDKQTITNLNKQIATLNQNLTQTNNINSQLQQQNTNLQKDKNNLTTQLEQFKKDKSSVEQERDNFQNQITQLQARIKELNTLIGLEETSEQMQTLTVQNTNSEKI